MYHISKTFELDFGHRVHNQILNDELSCSAPCACRHLHGHRGKIIVELESESLDQGMVTDFHHLNWFKKWIDTYLDHKMILDIQDPALSIMIGYPLPSLRSDTWLESDAWLREPISKLSYLLYPDPIKVSTLLSSSRAERDVIEGMVLVPFVPTAENFSRMLFVLIQNKMSFDIFGDRIKVSKVTFYETPKCKAEYTEN